MPSVVLGLACLALLLVAWIDFRTLRIANAHVLGLGALYLVFGLSTGWQSLPGDLVAGAVLFAIGIVFWLAGYQGGGDAKLALVLGLFVGIRGLLLYAILLLPVSVALYLLWRFGRRLAPQDSRLAELAGSGKVPYSLPMIAAALPSIMARAFWI